MFADLCQKKSLTDPTLLQGVSEFRGPPLGHFTLFGTQTEFVGVSESPKEQNGITEVLGHLVCQKCLSKAMALLLV